MSSDLLTEPFTDTTLDPPVRGFLHRPPSDATATLVLTHGAGGNAKSTLLIALAEKFAAQGFNVLRCDLPFRQARPYGPPRPGDALRDREGLKNAIAAVRKLASGRIFLGGQSYGGRQATLMCAESRDLVDGLILFSYPLHAPGKPDQPRIQHLPKLQVPCLFVHGTRDPFGSIEEMQSALKLIPSRKQLIQVEGAGHDLGFMGKAKNEDLPAKVLEAFPQIS
jgi:uncharacterized protein